MSSLSFWIGFLLYFSVLPLFSEKIHSECQPYIVHDFYEKIKFINKCDKSKINDNTGCHITRIINIDNGMIDHKIYTDCKETNTPNYCNIRLNDRGLPYCIYESKNDKELIQKCCCIGDECSDEIPWINPINDRITSYIDLIPLLIIFLINLAAATIVNHELKKIFIPFFRTTGCVRKPPTRICKKHGPTGAELMTALKRNNIHLFHHSSTVNTSSLLKLPIIDSVKEDEPENDTIWRKYHSITRIQEYIRRRFKFERELYKSECRAKLRKFKLEQEKKKKATMDPKKKKTEVKKIIYNEMLPEDKTQELSVKIKSTSTAKNTDGVLSIGDSRTITTTQPRTNKEQSNVLKIPVGSDSNIQSTNSTVMQLDDTQTSVTASTAIEFESSSSNTNKVIKKNK